MLRTAIATILAITLVIAPSAYAMDSETKKAISDIRSAAVIMKTAAELYLIGRCSRIIISHERGNTNFEMARWCENAMANVKRLSQAIKRIK
ncbi:MAG: hypothetical protein OXL41_14770 [Nitrospinae bacterium]|nr:hypothetical protein [Nitrospinota bacterium]